MKIYISGKITGDENFIEKFEQTKKFLEKQGQEPVNPAEHGLGPDATWEDYMKQDIKLLCDCDGIFMLHDWTESKGARLEYNLARILGLKIFFGTEGSK